jgi:hypothetical protein
MTHLPLWDELEELADRLAVAGQVKLPDLRTLRAASVQMGNWFEANQELREQVDMLKADCIKYRMALGRVKDSMTVVARHAGLEAHEINDDDFARDFSPFINLMNLHGDPDYGPPGKTTGHIDTKDAPRRKKKETT